MTVQYVKYLVAPLFTLLVFSAVNAASVHPYDLSICPGIRLTSMPTPLYHTDKGIQAKVPLRSFRDSGLIATVKQDTETTGEAELNADGPMQKNKGVGGKDEVLELKKRIIEIQNRRKLGFRKVVLCSKVEGFGVYFPLPKGKLAPKLVFYFEPANVGTLVTNNRYVIDCTVDVSIFNSAGKTATRNTKSLKFHRVSRSPVLDLYFMLPIKFEKPPRKGFSLRVVLNDNIKNQRIGITIRIGTKKKSRNSVKSTPERRSRDFTLGVRHFQRFHQTDSDERTCRLLK